MKFKYNLKKKMNLQNQMIKKAIEFATLAVVNDKEEKFQAAIQNYEKSLELLLECMKGLQHKSSFIKKIEIFSIVPNLEANMKETLKSKAREYMHRAEFVKALLDQDDLGKRLSSNLLDSSKQRKNAPVLPSKERKKSGVVIDLTMEDEEPAEKPPINSKSISNATEQKKEDKNIQEVFNQLFSISQKVLASLLCQIYSFFSDVLKNFVLKPMKCLWKEAICQKRRRSS